MMGGKGASVDAFEAFMFCQLRRCEAYWSDHPHRQRHAPGASPDCLDNPSLL